MEEGREHRVVESPLAVFVRRGWLDWEQRITFMQVDESEFLLYLVWALDAAKEQDEGINGSLRKRVFDGIRKRSLNRHFNTPKDDLEYVTNLVCACLLYCYGLTLTGSDVNRRIFSEIVNGFGEHWPAVRVIRSEVERTQMPKGLKEWMVAYMKEDEYFTLSDVVEWYDGEASVLCDVAGSRNPVVNLTINNNIERFENQSGAVFNDNSTTQILTEYGEDRKLLQ